MVVIMMRYQDMTPSHKLRRPGQCWGVEYFWSSLQPTNWLADRAGLTLKNCTLWTDVTVSLQHLYCSLPALEVSHGNANVSPRYKPSRCHIVEQFPPTSCDIERDFLLLSDSDSHSDCSRYRELRVSHSLLTALTVIIFSALGSVQADTSGWLW